MNARPDRRKNISLLVISSGFGRTGTKSLKDALEQIGFASCHHMHEVLEHPEQAAHWQAVAAGQSVDWHTVFNGYRSQVDWPGAHVWRELSIAFPHAKIVHTLRPEESWWNSFFQDYRQAARHLQTTGFTAAHGKHARCRIGNDRTADIRRCLGRS